MHPNPAAKQQLLQLQLLPLLLRQLLPLLCYWCWCCCCWCLSWVLPCLQQLQ
jgi:hypothetical protein